MELILEERSSKGVVKNYYSGINSQKKFNEVPYMYNVLMDMVESDPILFRACDMTVTLLTSKGFDFIGKNNEQIRRARKLFKNELDFDNVIRNVLWQLIVYGNSYLELRWNESKTQIMELHPLESTEIKIKYSKNGEIQYYLQKVAEKDEDKWPKFETDEVIFFRLYWIGAQVYSKNPFKAIGRNFATSIYANDYLTSIFRNLSPKIIYFLKTSSEKSRKLFIENLIRAKTNPNIDVVAMGEAFDSKVAQVQFDNGLIDVLKWLEKRVLMITGVPPHWMGIVDGTNRGIGENVTIPYESKIKDLQHEIASQINKELMPKLGFNLEFKWNAMSLMTEKEIINNMSVLTAQGVDSETTISYARERGLNLREGAKIEKIEKPQLQDDTAPSRKRAGPKDTMNINLNKKGVSPEGKKKLDAKKVVV